MSCEFFGTFILMHAKRVKNKLLGCVHTKSDVATQAGSVVERLCGREVKLQSSPVVRCAALASDRREMWLQQPKSLAGRQVCSETRQWKRRRLSQLYHRGSRQKWEGDAAFSPLRQIWCERSLKLLDVYGTACENGKKEGLHLFIFFGHFTVSLLVVIWQRNVFSGCWRWLKTSIQSFF